MATARQQRYHPSRPWQLILREWQSVLRSHDYRMVSDILHGSTNAGDCGQLLPPRIGLAAESGGAEQATPAEGVATWLEELFECQVYGSNDFSQNSVTPVLVLADSARSDDQVKYALAWAHFSTAVLTEGRSQTILREAVAVAWVRSMSWARVLRAKLLPWRATFSGKGTEERGSLR